jgi:hypothetical protein
VSEDQQLITGEATLYSLGAHSHAQRRERRSAYFVCRRKDWVQTNFQNELAAEMSQPDPIAVELELLLAMSWDRCPCFGHNPGFPEIHNLPR